MRSPRTSRPDELVGRRVAPTHLLKTKSGGFLTPGQPCRIVHHTKGRFGLEPLNGPYDVVAVARRKDFEVLS